MRSSTIGTDVFFNAFFFDFFGACGTSPYGRRTSSAFIRKNSSEKKAKKQMYL